VQVDIDLWMNRFSVFWGSDSTKINSYFSAQYRFGLIIAVSDVAQRMSAAVKVTQYTINLLEIVYISLLEIIDFKGFKLVSKTFDFSLSWCRMCWLVECIPGRSNENSYGYLEVPPMSGRRC